MAFSIEFLGAWVGIKGQKGEQCYKFSNFLIQNDILDLLLPFIRSFLVFLARNGEADEEVDVGFCDCSKWGARVKIRIYRYYRLVEFIIIFFNVTWNKMSGSNSSQTTHFRFPRLKKRIVFNLYNYGAFSKSIFE